VSNPHVTLAILTRNRPECLAIALEAALATQDPPDDILVSDDSDDVAATINRATVARHPGVRYTVGPHRGLGANENHIVANLLPEAEWVVFNGDDTRLARNFVCNLRTALLRYAPHQCLPTGTETRNGALIRAHRLSFLGFQEVPHDDYSPGSSMQTVVVQATAFPAEALREVSWLEVSAYGYDEVDMAHKMQKLGWQFVFEPDVTLVHDQSDIGRDEYSRPTQIARLYFRMRSFSVYEHRPLALTLYLVVAPTHLLAAQVRRRNWRGACEVPAITSAAVTAWFRSLRHDWRHG
jgi:GT2 family glycosyltransferase